MNKKLLSLLYRSFDSSLNPQEEKILENALLESQQLRDEKKKIIAMRQFVADTSDKAFEPFFADKIMRKIKTRKENASGMETIFDSLIDVFRPVAIGAAIILLLLISYNLGKSKNFSFASAVGEPEVTLEEVLDPSLTITQEWK